MGVSLLTERRALGCAPFLPLRFPRPDVNAFELVLVSLPLTRGALEWLASADDCNVDESGGLDQRDVLSFQESAADSGSPDRNVLAARRGDVFVDDDVGDLQPATVLQHAECFAEHGVLARAEIDDAVGDDEIGSRVF